MPPPGVALRGEGGRKRRSPPTAIACVAAAAPNAWFLAEYLWSHRPTSGLAMATAAPLNVLVATVGDVFSARVLACVSLVSAIAQWGTQRAVRVAGLKAL